MTSTSEKQVGRSVARKEDERLVLGQGAFSEDIEPPGTVWVHFVRSPHAHARIKGIDMSTTLEDPRVLRVITGKEIHPRYHPLPAVPLSAYEADPAPFYLMAVDKARYSGEVVAIVVATDRYAARDAAETVVVDYEVLPVANEVEDAIRPGAPRVHEDRENGALVWR